MYRGMALGTHAYSGKSFLSSACSLELAGQKKVHVAPKAFAVVDVLCIFAVARIGLSFHCS